MTANYSESTNESANRIEEAIEINQQVWQRVCDESAANNMTNAEFIEHVLRQHLSEVE